MVSAGGPVKDFIVRLASGSIAERWGAGRLK